MMAVGPEGRPEGGVALQEEVRGLVIPRGIRGGKMGFTVQPSK